MAGGRETSSWNGTMASFHCKSSAEGVRFLYVSIWSSTAAGCLEGARHPSKNMAMISFPCHQRNSRLKDQSPERQGPSGTQTMHQLDESKSNFVDREGKTLSDSLINGRTGSWGLAVSRNENLKNLLVAANSTLCNRAFRRKVKLSTPEPSSSQTAE